VTPDELIAAIARGEREVGGGDGELVRRHIAASPFNREIRAERSWSQIGESVVGCPHPVLPGQVISATTALSSLEFHIAKRIRDGQWKPNTSPDQYESDCQRAASKATIVKAGVRGNPLAATQTYAAAADFPQMLVKPGQAVLVVYDTVKHRITTSYYLPAASLPLQVYKYWVQNPRPVVLPVSAP
jgi:hypothetical protein